MKRTTLQSSHRWWGPVARALQSPHRMNLALAPAWTIEIDGKVYSVRRVGGSIYEVWRKDERLGSFEFFPHTAHGPTAYVHDGPETRAVANAFVEAYRS